MGHQEMNLQFAFVLDDAQGRVQICGIRDSDLADWVPKLAEGLGLSRSKIREVRLIVGVNTGHQLDVGTVVVGKTAVPRITELVISPGPLFFAWCNVMVRYMHDSSASRVIVATEEI